MQCSRMEFCDVSLPTIVANLECPAVPGRRGAIGPGLGCVLEHTERCPTLFLWPDWTLSSWRKSQGKLVLWRLEHYSWICGCQNWVQGPRDRGNIVERCLDGFHALGTARFWQLLAFQHEFLSRPASPDSEQLGGRTVRGRSGALGLRFGYVLEHTVRILFNAVFMTRLD